MPSIPAVDIIACTPNRSRARARGSVFFRRAADLAQRLGSDSWLTLHTITRTSLVSNLDKNRKCGSETNQKPMYSPKQPESCRSTYSKNDTHKSHAVQLISLQLTWKTHVNLQALAAQKKVERCAPFPSHGGGASGSLVLFFRFWRTAINCNILY